jgi:7-cyano-7-deazaguanine synthase in queuosine biosynthesis
MPGWRCYRPFANLDKKGIAELYEHFNLMDTLFPITKSCEAKTYDWTTPHCGTCWWCHERQWGFGRLI